MNNNELKSFTAYFFLITLALNTSNAFSHGESNKKSLSYFNKEFPYKLITTPIHKPNLTNQVNLSTIKESINSIITLLDENKINIINQDVSIMMKLHDANLKFEDSLEQLNQYVDKSNDQKKINIMNFLHDLSLSFTQYRILISQNNIEKSKIEISHTNDKLPLLSKHLNDISPTSH